MIDAVFLLLIFFMTTTVFVKATQLKIELPDSVHYDQLKAEKKLNLRISSEGPTRDQRAASWPWDS